VRSHGSEQKRKEEKYYDGRDIKVKRVGLACIILAGKARAKLAQVGLGLGLGQHRIYA
jgi:hypothetical protein